MDQDLYSFLKNNKPVTIHQIQSIFRQLLEGLCILEQLNIVHRDVKLENVMVSRSLVAKLCDFGSAKFLSQKLNSPYVVTQHYRAPELFLNYSKYDTRIDVWSFGCMLVEMISGGTLIDGESEGDQFIRIVELLGGIKREDRKLFLRDQPSLKETFSQLDGTNLDFS